jgi:hypothetical protein
MAFNEAKLRELAVHIAWKSKQDPNLGKTKLLKLLAYCDFRAYQKLGHSITGATYLKLPFGPAPKEGRGLLNLLRATGRIDIRDEELFDYSQDRIVATGPANVDVFDADELGVVEQVVEAFHGHNNTQMRDASHRDFAGWALAREEMDEIPYSTVYLSPPEPPESADSKHVQDLVRQAAAAREQSD